MNVILKEEALRAVEQGCGMCSEEIEALNTIKITKCSDCLYREDIPCTTLDPELRKCKIWKTLIQPHEFCSRGEPKV